MNEKMNSHIARVHPVHLINADWAPVRLDDVCLGWRVMGGSALLCRMSSKVKGQGHGLWTRELVAKKVEAYAPTAVNQVL